MREEVSKEDSVSMDELKKDVSERKNDKEDGKEDKNIKEGAKEKIQQLNQLWRMHKKK